MARYLTILRIHPRPSAGTLVLQQCREEVKVEFGIEVENGSRQPSRRRTLSQSCAHVRSARLSSVCPSMRLLDVVVCLVVLLPAVALAVKAPLSYRNVTSTRVKKRTGAWICDV